MTSSRTTSRIESHGFEWARGAIAPPLLDRLDLLCREIAAIGGSVRRRVAGVRIVFERCPEYRDLLSGPLFVSLAARGLAIANLDEVRAIKAILFQKTPSANWLVSWHQDLTIAVTERRPVEGFSGWSRKDGVPHVQAPTAVLERIVALRIHLDPCDELSGALEVIPRSHALGRIEPADIAAVVERGTPMTCIAERGDVLLMRPLVVHRSRPAERPSGRRVLHVEYSASSLPGGLEWA